MRNAPKGSPSFKEKILTTQEKKEEFAYPDVTDEQFFREVLTRDGDTLLMVRIVGCGDCKVARPYFFEAQKQFPSINFITIEWEKNPGVMTWLNEHEKVRAAPDVREDKLRRGNRAESGHGASKGDDRSAHALAGLTAAETGDTRAILP